MMLCRKLAVFLSIITFASATFALNKKMTCPDLDVIKAAGIASVVDSGVIGYIGESNSVRDRSAHVWNIFVGPFYTRSHDYALLDAQELLSSLNAPGVPVHPKAGPDYCTYNTGRVGFLAFAFNMSGVSAADEIVALYNRLH